GVRRDGIPPLTNPNTLSARQAEYLADSDVVFGVSINGDARCYPKRILAWHEMVRDTVGGVPINGVYCTLCGSMIVYDTRWNDRQFLLGTSGFLYRSNKLMYDRETKSLWSTICGRPVVGPLVEENISLNRLHVVTSTWGQWRQQHPDTRVLSLNTGHERDYGEGVAYRDYFATDDLMFDVPARDNRLSNKASVLVMRDGDRDPTAISAEFLKEHSVYHETVGDTNVVVLTDAAGANRVYAVGDRNFKATAISDIFTDRSGNRWRQTESALLPIAEPSSLAEAAPRSGLPRFAAHRAFWFGWYASYPNTRLIGSDSGGSKPRQ
ncbi:MAG: DUF3179 domain-containing protein, partial [Planctomycetota bacterium]